MLKNLISVKIIFRMVSCIIIKFFLGVMNCGRNVRKNSVVFGFRILVKIVCLKVCGVVMGICFWFRLIEVFLKIVFKLR